MDIERFKTVKGVIETKINIERSIFIATLSYVEDERKAKEFISEISKRYKDATHNCPAYRVIENGNILEFSSDAGEPSGTAGLPMLNTLRKNDLLNVAVVVTRYFGGVKLGVRGLIDAYSQAVQEVIDKAVDMKSIVVKKRAYKQKLKIDFSSYGKKMQQLSYMGVTILDISYTEAYAYLEVIYDKPLDISEVESTEEVYI
ncbi:MAG: IMPACT family protein [Fervidobacterium nodosum]